MQGVVSDALQAFVQVSGDETDAAIDQVLATIGRHAGVDRVYVFAVDLRRWRIANTHEWCADGIDPEIENLRDLDYDVIHGWHASFAAGEPVHVDDVAELGPARQSERDHLEAQGIRSLLAVPMLVDGEVCGLMGFDAVRAPRVFHTGEVTLLRLVADVVGAALVRRRAIDELRHQATHDVLTTLPNRAKLRDDLAAALEGDGLVGVLFIDVDRFKMINDALGHFAGDSLLHALGIGLARLVEPHLLVRFGGDEFVVVTDGLAEEAIQNLAERVVRWVADGVDAFGGRQHVSVSVGWTTTAESGRDGDELLRDADTALYRAKEMGRDRAVRFVGALRQEVVRRRELYQHLPGALAEGRIRPAFMPVLRFDTNTVTHVEALARWDHPELGQVPPLEFVGVAEDLGVIARLGQQILAKSLQQLRNGPDAVGLTVNLSPVELMERDVVTRLASTVRGAGVDAARVVFEITESALMQSPRHARDVLGALRERGFRIALDDFGTGYSSLAQLRDLPIDVMKVDRSFTERLFQSAHDDQALRGIVRLGLDLGMTVVAEGVETFAQLEALRAMGVQKAQGYLIGRPAETIRTVADVVV